MNKPANQLKPGDVIRDPKQFIGGWFVVDTVEYMRSWVSVTAIMEHRTNPFIVCSLFWDDEIEVREESAPAESVS